MTDIKLLVPFLLSIVCGKGVGAKVRITRDKDIWLTSEEGHHFMLDDETGDIKAGFGGKIKHVSEFKTVKVKNGKAQEYHYKQKISSAPTTAQPHTISPKMLLKAQSTIDNVLGTEKQARSRIKSKKYAQEIKKQLIANGVAKEDEIFLAQNTKDQYHIFVGDTVFVPHIVPGYGVQFAQRSIGKFFNSEHLKDNRYLLRELAFSNPKDNALQNLEEKFMTGHREKALQDISSLGDKNTAGIKYANGKLTQTGHPTTQEEKEALGNLMSLSEKAAFMTFLGGKYPQINKVQTTNTPNGDFEIDRSSEEIENGLRKLPRWVGGPLYRGIQIPIKDIEKLKSGNDFPMQGTSFWSSDNDTAHTFATQEHWVASTEPLGSVIMEIEKPPKVAASVNHIAFFPEQNQVLASKDTKLRIKSISTDEDGVTRVKLEEYE